jgi:hypothetical protein
LIWCGEIFEKHIRTEMQNKNFISLKTALICCVTGGLAGGVIAIMDSFILLILLPGLSMGFFFAKTHRQFSVFQKKWKVQLVFSIAYIAALFWPAEIFVFPSMEKAGLYDIDLNQIIIWNIKGLAGTAIVLLLIRIVFMIRLKWFHVIVLLLLGTASTYFFYADYLGDYRIEAGFAVWQGVVGGLLSFSVLNAKNKLEMIPEAQQKNPETI